jgi:hypothetical protein
VPTRIDCNRRNSRGTSVRSPLARHSWPSRAHSQ